MMASSCQKPIRYNVRGLYFHFVKRQQSYLQSCCCRAIGKTNSTIVWRLENVTEGFSTLKRIKAQRELGA